MITENKFVLDNKPTWEELESLLNKRNRSFEETKKLGSLYQEATENLSFAQTNFSGSKVVLYLNELVRRCHLIFYRPEKPKFKNFFSFLAVGFPRILVNLKIPILVSTTVFLIVIFISFFMVKNNPELAEMFLDPNSYQRVRSDLELREKFGNFDNIPEEQRVGVSLFIWLNNSKVALLAFVLGITFGIGTLFILVSNGFMLGSLLAVYYMNGHFADFFSIIMVHGSIELPAIVVSSGAGLFLASAIFFPNRERRIEKIKNHAGIAFKCLLGVVIFLLWAGIVEGMVTTLKLPVNLRFIIALSHTIFLTFYFLIGIFVKPKGMR